MTETLRTFQFRELDIVDGFGFRASNFEWMALTSFFPFNDLGQLTHNFVWGAL